MRKLTLRKELGVELTTDELTSVNGGAQSGNLCPTNPCITPQPSQLRCSYSLGEAVCG